MIPGINVKHLVDRVLRPDVNARGFRYSVVEEKIVDNIDIMYNRNLRNTGVEPFDISGMYKDVNCYNWQQSRSINRKPSVKVSYVLELAERAKTAVNRRMKSLRERHHDINYSKIDSKVEPDFDNE